MARQLSDLRVLVCEDEYLLASDMATQLANRGVHVVGIMSRVSDIHAALGDDGFEADAAVLDLKLLDGDAASVVVPMLARRIAVVLCTGYGTRDLPPELAHLPKVGKPTDIDELLAVLLDNAAPEDLEGE
ncbi:MAG TPA: hypothetical protein VGN60_12710 [Devosia sp.]|jgi:ActR/RegA family two-component response regulator|nr:hypothetical protein [Devosia sp.]